MQVIDPQGADQAAPGDEEGNPSPAEASEPSQAPKNQSYRASLESPGGAPIPISIEERPTPQDGASVQVILNLPETAHLQVTVEALPPGEKGQEPASRLVFRSRGMAAPGVTVETGAAGGQAVLPKVLSAPAAATARRRWPYSLEQTLFGLALLLYLATRLVGLTHFPIYFFSDEAIQSLSAADLIRDNLRGEDGTLLPTYFKNGPFYNLSLSVYLQVLPYLLFGKSVLVTRGTAVVIGLLAAAALGLILRDIFRIPYWWAGTLLLSIAPAWFLHSRTAFETVIFASFYACFLYAYLLYRYRSPRFLYTAILMGALAFYSYSPGQLVIGLTGLLLLLSDARYHWQNRAVVARGSALLLLLALPYIRFRLGHPAAPTDHLSRLGSYVVQPLPLAEKVRHYASEYLFGLSPGYWFLPNERDLVRHQMRGYGHLLRATLPFAAIGLILTLRGLRSSANRALLIALLVAPAGSALIQIGITRVLVFVIPATLLTALGLSWLLAWLEKQLQAGRRVHQALSWALFGVLAAINIVMLRDALANGPTWYQDYGLGGMQYGGRQLYAEVQKTLQGSPSTKLIVSHSWANGADVVARYFLGDPLPIVMSTIEAYMFEHLPLEPDTLFVMTPEEYQLARESGKFADIQVEKTLSYPNGQPGFYFVRLRYVDNIDQILEAEWEQRRALQGGQVTVDGQPVPVRYSPLDMGEIGSAFDGDPATLARTLEANPAILELTFPEPRSIHQIRAIIGSTTAEIRALLYPPGGQAPVEYIRMLQGTVEEPEVVFPLQDAPLATKLRLEIRDVDQPEPGHIHIWEIKLE